MAQQTPNTAAFLPAAGAALVLGERPIPTPGPNELLIRTHAIGINPIDWKRQAFGIAIPSYPTILGADVAGVVVAVGSDVASSGLFRLGNRVLGSADAMGSGNIDHAGFQTYTILSASATAPLPSFLSFTDAATLPTATSTPAIALYETLGLPAPGVPLPAHSRKTGILIWGGASQVGAGTIQIAARQAGLTVFAAASPAHHARLRELGATGVVDYRSPTVVEDLLAAAEQAGVEITLGVDAVSSEQTLKTTAEVLSRFTTTEKKGRLATVAPWPQGLTVPGDGSLEVEWVQGGKIWSDRKDLGELLFNQLLAGWLERGEFVPGKAKVLEGGLGALQKGLEELKKGVSGEKLVVEV
ncbi:chaperonin 10-like protein [Chaetomium sp. MPI-SDFR-AT-0129]|nr:chaperonin 10-like protein [Chaetomium sp. MPI-SDFR-AT-0129]